jgi:ribosomal protein L24
MKTIKLKDIIAISGKGGLYKFIAQARNGIVVESLESKKRHVAPATARVNSLEDIAIFTHEEEVPLADIFYLIHEKSEGKKTLSHKAPEGELKARFKELVPDYDEDRVYISDIKKVFHWYNELQEFGLLELIDKKKDDEEAASEEEKPVKPSQGQNKGPKDPGEKEGSGPKKA